MKGVTVHPVDFIQHLYGGFQPPAGYIEFRAIPSKARRWMPWPTFKEHPDAFDFSWFPEGQNVYFGVSLRTEHGQGDAEHVHPTHLLWVDLDLKGTQYVGGDLDLKGWTPEDLREAAQQAFQDFMGHCEEFHLPPLAVVYSGHGLQAYWAREIRSTTADTEAYNRGLIQLFSGDHKVYDCARILRLPGGWNWKAPARPLPVEVWHMDPAKPTIPRDRLKGLWRDKPKRELKAAPAEQGPTYHASPTDTVIAQFNAQHPIREMLKECGYLEDGDRFTRPGEGASGRDVVLLQNSKGVLCSFHHSSSDQVSMSDNDGHLNDPFDLFCLYKHGGDRARAVRAAALELGIAHEQTPAKSAQIRHDPQNKAPERVQVKKPQAKASSPLQAGVFIQAGGYCMEKEGRKGSDVVQLTNWVWEPHLRLRYPDGTSGEQGTLIVAGRHFDLNLKSGAWGSRRELLAAVGGYNAVVFSTDNGDVARIRQHILLDNPDLPEALGVHSYGLHPSPVGNGWIQVYDGEIQGPEGELFYAGPNFNPGGQAYKPPRKGTEGEEQAALEALMVLPQLVTSDVAYALLGYGAAACFAPRITPHLGNRLPFLYIAGEKESGKTSSAQIALELFTGNGKRISKAPGITAYQYEVAFSGANNLLGLLDEYRPHIPHVDEALRKHHDFGIKTRGTGGGKPIDVYELNAPLIVLGEGFTDDAATKSRGVLYFTRYSDRGEEGVYAKLLKAPLWAWAAKVHELARTLDEDTHMARLGASRALAAHHVGGGNPRLQYALTFIAYGLLTLEALGAPLPEGAVAACLGQGVRNMLEGGSMGGSNLESFLEQLAFSLTRVQDPSMYVMPSGQVGELILRVKPCLELVKSQYREAAAVSNAVLLKQFAEQALYFAKGETFRGANGAVVRGLKLVLGDIPERCDADLLLDFDSKIRKVLPPL